MHARHVLSGILQLSSFPCAIAVVGLGCQENNVEQTFPRGLIGSLMNLDMSRANGFPPCVELQHSSDCFVKALYDIRAMNTKHLYQLQKG